MQPLTVMSFFSGAMGLDLGLEKAGLHIRLACEVDNACRQTIRANRPGVPLVSDVRLQTAGSLREAAGFAADESPDVMVGGPPCQSFSTAGARRGFSDDRGNLMVLFLNLIRELRPRFAVIENVRGLLSSKYEDRVGGALQFVLGHLRDSGYGVTFNLYNAANFGVPQSRERVILLCARDGARLPWLNPTHAEDGAAGLPRWRTLRDALSGLPDAPCDHAAFPEERLRFYRLLGPGQYWKHLPPALHAEALKGAITSGGGKTGFLRRLAWDRPSCTLVTSPTMPATDICHPEQHRPLSIQEYKRIQQFPDDWQVCGSLSDQYRQIGNAVPVGLGEAVGRALIAHTEGRRVEPPPGFHFSRYKNTNDKTWTVGEVESE